MARAKKSGSTGNTSKAKTEDVVTEDSKAEDTGADSAETEAPVKPPADEIADTTPAESATPEEEVASRAEAEDEATPEAEPDPEDRDAEPAEERPEETASHETEALHPVPVPVAPEPQGSRFWPLVLGGAVAAGLGFAAAQLDLFSERDPALDVARLTTDVEEQAARIASLEEAQPVAPDLSPIDDMRAGLDALSAQINDFDSSLTTLSDRITVLEERPVTSAEDTGLDDAYARELAALQESVEDQRTEIEALLQNALSVEEATAKAAQASAAQTALAQIMGAIESGQPYPDAVASLGANEAVDVPEALVAHADTGVATLAELQAEFPSVSRASLAAARASDPEESEGGFGSFIKRQLGARSVAPREGTDADAVLSRAEEAMREGRLSDALAETEALSEAARAEMEGWLEKAMSRDAVQDAASELAQRLTAN